MHLSIIKKLRTHRTQQKHAALLLIMTMLVLLIGCSKADTKAPTDVTATIKTDLDQAAIPVRVAYVSDESLQEVLRFAGVARPQQRASLSFQVGGNIEARYAEIGQQVNQGDVVARLYNPNLGPALEAAEARLAQLTLDAEQAERDLQRLQHMHERGLLAVQDLEQQRTRLRTTQASVENARALVAQNHQVQKESELRAPFTGRIEQVLMEPGEFTQAGQPVIRMSAEAGMEVEVRIPPRMLNTLSLGDELPIWHGLSGEKYIGHIAEIGEGNSGNSALYPLVVSLDKTTLRSGEALEVGVTRAQSGALSIPLNAVLRSADGLAVFKINELAEELIVSRIPVSVERIAGDRVLLTAGSLAPGDRVVYAGITRLADGDSVQVLNSVALAGGG